ncbi:MAG: hypothetical protein WCX31_18680 [Salinivirgaceae bacterium]
MNNTLQFSYSSWFLILALIIAVAASMLLYRKRTTDDEWSKIRRIVLGSIRFMILFVLGFLLLIPVLKTRSLKSKKPLIVIAQDNSKSLVLSNDSVYNRTLLPNQINSLVQKLSAKYEVKTLQFGEKTDSLTWKFSDKETNFESLFSVFNTGFLNENIGALLISSDGIVNRGNSPIFSAQNLSFPIYCLALGDTNSLIDFSIKQIDCNKIAFKGNNIPVFVNISATDFKGKMATVELVKDEKVLASQTIEVDAKQYFKKLAFQIKADSLGINEYQLRIQSDIKDENLLNNSKRFYVEVTENQKKILLLFDGYHPDIAVFQNVMAGNQAFKLTKIQSNQPIDSIENYDLVILHQLPSNTQNLQHILSSIILHEIPVLFVIGQQTSIKALNNLKTQLQIEQNKELNTEIFPSLNAAFSLFKTTIDADVLNGFPSLQIPLGNYPEVPLGNCLLYQRIGQIGTSKPLWFFSESGNYKAGFIVGEGIWKWSLYEYSRFSNHSITSELILKSIQHLTSENKKEPLVIEISPVLEQEKPVFFNAKLFNPSYELVNEPDLFLEITDELSNRYPYVFQKTENAYSLSVGSLPLGTYRYQAKTKLGENSIQKSGKFIIQESQLEKNELMANHALLYRLANEHRGKLFYKEQFDELAEELLKNNTIIPVVFEKKGYFELINFKGLFILLLVLACTEWFLRKYWGSI